MKDAQLHLEKYFAAAGAGAVNTDILDLNIDLAKFSDNWRLGRLRVAIPALPNNTDATKDVLVTLQDSADGGATFANTKPLVQAVITGVANDGSAAIVIDFPLPPGTRGPVRLALTVPAGAGDNTAGLVVADWLNE